MCYKQSLPLFRRWTWRDGCHYRGVVPGGMFLAGKISLNNISPLISEGSTGAERSQAIKKALPFLREMDYRQAKPYLDGIEARVEDTRVWVQETAIQTLGELLFLFPKLERLRLARKMIPLLETKKKPAHAAAGMLGLKLFPEFQDETLLSLKEEIVPLLDRRKSLTRRIALWVLSRMVPHLTDEKKQMDIVRRIESKREDPDEDVKWTLVTTLDYLLPRIPKKYRRPMVDFMLDFLPSAGFQTRGRGVKFLGESVRHLYPRDREAVVEILESLYQRDGYDTRILDQALMAAVSTLPRSQKIGPVERFERLWAEDKEEREKAQFLLKTWLEKGVTRDQLWETVDAVTDKLSQEKTELAQRSIPVLKLLTPHLHRVDVESLYLLMGNLAGWLWSEDRALSDDAHKVMRELWNDEGIRWEVEKYRHMLDAAHAAFMANLIHYLD